MRRRRRRRKHRHPHAFLLCTNEVSANENGRHLFCKHKGGWDGLIAALRQHKKNRRAWLPSSVVGNPLNGCPHSPANSVCSKTQQAVWPPILEPHKLGLKHRSTQTIIMQHTCILSNPAMNPHLSTRMSRFLFGVGLTQALCNAIIVVLKRYDCDCGSPSWLCNKEQFQN